MISPCRRWLSGCWCSVQRLIQPHSSVDHMQLSIFQKENKLCFSFFRSSDCYVGGAVAAVIMWGWRFIDLYWVSRWAQAHYTALCCSDKAGDWHQWPTPHSRQAHPPPVTYLTMQSQRKIMASQGISDKQTKPEKIAIMKKKEKKLVAKSTFRTSSRSERNKELWRQRKQGWINWPTHGLCGRVSVCVCAIQGCTRWRNTLRV